MKFLDTNVIIRFLTRDDEEKAEACYQLLQRASRGVETLLTCEAIITEVVYVLSSQTSSLQTHSRRNQVAPNTDNRDTRPQTAPKTCLHKCPQHLCRTP